LLFAASSSGIRFPNFSFLISIFCLSDFHFPIPARLCDINLAVNLNRTQILGALILAAIALVAMLLRWKFASH
jgi:hypothetical protein